MISANQSVGRDCVCGSRRQRFACCVYCLDHQESHLEQLVAVRRVSLNNLQPRRSVSDHRSKCLKHNPGKKSAVGDKPATRKGIMALDTSRLPFVRGVQTCADFTSQASTVCPFIGAMLLHR